MKLLAFFLLLMLPLPCYALQTGTTSAGKKILLYSDGTWEYKKNKKPEDIKKSSKDITRSHHASFLAKSSVTKAVLWVDTNKWSFSDDIKAMNGYAEYGLKAKGKEINAIMLNTKVQSSLDYLSEISLNYVKTIAESVTTIKKEYRTVNNNTILYHELAANVRGRKIIACNIYYADRAGSTQINVWTPAKHIDKYRKDIEYLLSGFDII